MDLKRDRTHDWSHKNSDRAWHVNDGFKHAHEPNRVKVSSPIKKAVRHLQLFPGPTEYPLCLPEE